MYRGTLNASPSGITQSEMPQVVFDLETILPDFLHFKSHLFFFLSLDNNAECYKSTVKKCK